MRLIVRFPVICLLNMWENAGNRGFNYLMPDLPGELGFLKQQFTKPWQRASLICTENTSIAMPISQQVARTIYVPGKLSLGSRVSTYDWRGTRDQNVGRRTDGARQFSDPGKETGVQTKLVSGRRTEPT